MKKSSITTSLTMISLLAALTGCGSEASLFGDDRVNIAGAASLFAAAETVTAEDIAAILNADITTSAI